MAIKPILFNTEMVRAILDGRKTVTRRCVRKKGCIIRNNQEINKNLKSQFEPYNVTARCGIPQNVFFKPPYELGDILYVRETWLMADDGSYYYKAGESESQRQVREAIRYKWNPSIHMPKEAARIFLKVTDVKVERLQEMTASESEKEGIRLPPHYDTKERAYILAFADLWDSTIKKIDLDTYGWYANPWVWVIDFEQCEEPEKEGVDEQ